MNPGINVRGQHRSRGQQPPVEPSNLTRTLAASGWMYSSRALVFGWALLIAHTFGIGSYGLYAMAFSAGAMLGVPLDSYFTTRGPRVSSDVFMRERTTRMLFGFTLMVAGVVAWPISFLVGFATVKAGSDVAFQASRSYLIREGQPDRAQRADAIRQVVGMACGSAYLLLMDQPDLRVAAALYLAGAACPIMIGLKALVHARPSFPEISVRSMVILAESFFGVAYVHLEVLLLGFFASPDAAGYYAFGAAIVWSLASLGQSFGTTFHRDLREGGGSVASGPPLRTAAWLSAATGSAVAVAAVVLWATGVDERLWVTFALLAPVSFLRTLSSVSTVVLVLQHRDQFRLLVTCVSLATKVTILLVLQNLGGPGAAIAFLVSDLIMSGAYARAVYGNRPRGAVRA